jgi:Toprim domain
MTALTYSALVELCDGRLGVRDVPCPSCGPGCNSPSNRKRPVLRVYHGEPGFATYNCARCGEKGWARDNVESGCHPGRALVESGTLNADRQLEKARWLWRRREPIEGSPAEVYLRRARGYGGVLPGPLGFLVPSKPEHHPALIGAFGVPIEIEPGVLSISDDQVRGVHLTLLNADGSGKANIERPKFMVGPSSGWPIVMAPPNDMLGLAITEGIEDALTVHEATGLGAWAAGSAGRMKALADRVPDWIETVTIYSHADEAGQRGARMLADALVLRGIEVFVEGVVR